MGRSSVAQVAVLVTLGLGTSCSSHEKSGNSPDAGTGGAPGSEDAADAVGGHTASGGATTGGSTGHAGGAIASTGGTAAKADAGAPAPDGGDRDASPPRIVHGTCAALAPVGTWEEITPEGVSLPGPDGAPYGVNAFVVDPNTTGTVYLGTSAQGIWKTTDCGATWAHVNTGTNSPKCGSDDKYCSEVLDTGRQWTMAIDPVDSQVLYANNGFGQYTLGLMKSTNGGVDWKPIWPPPNAAPDQYKGASDFVGTMTLDPFDHRHLIVDFHSDCSAPYTSLCLAESKDGGDTWRVVSGDQAMGGFAAHDSRSYILGDSHSWLFAAAGSLWRTGNSGDTWSKVSELVFHGQIYRAKTGVLYLGGQDGILRSEDNGVDWSLVPDSGNLVGGLTGDGENMYSSSYASCLDWGTDLHPYRSSNESDGALWSPMQSPGIEQGGGVLAYDADHHVLYSSNCQRGFWRVRTQ